MSNKEDIKDFKARASKYWREFDPDRFQGISPTTREENAELRAAFKERFGKDGSKFLNKLVLSEKLNGGMQPDKDKHFPGMIYSIPVGIYFMRRALGQDKNQAYKTFTYDVYTHADAQKIHPRIPRQAHVEKLCFEEMIQMRTTDLFKSSFDLAMLPAITASTMLAGITQSWAEMMGWNTEEPSEDIPENDGDDLTL